jgi:AcrR family transcriptional regulator
MDSVKTGTRRKRKQKEARRSDIIGAALRLFAEKGFAATRLDDVAEAAGIAKGTVYLYFETKEELFREIVRQELLPTLDRLEEAIAAHQGPAADLLRLLLARLAQLIDSDAGAIPKLVVCEAGNFPEIARFYADEVVGRGQLLLERILQRGIGRGEFRPVDTEHILPGFIGPVLLMLLWRHSIGRYSERQFDPGAVLATQLDILLRGLAPDL